MVKDKKKKFNFTVCCCEAIISELVKKLLQKIEKFNPEIEDLKFKVKMSAREMIANALEHGCNQKQDEINIFFKIKKSEVMLAVKDPGPGFDWENKDLNQMPLLQEKGRGLAMINQAADKIKFNESGNKIKVYFKS